MTRRSWILTFLILTFPQVAPSKEPVRFYLFYSEETGGLKIEKEMIGPLSKKYPIEVQSFSVNQLKNYGLLTKFEKELKDVDNELPVVIIGNKILGGEAEIKRDLEGLIRFHAEKGGTPWPSLEPIGPEEGWIPRAPTEEEKKSKKIIYAAFLYMPGCLHCEEMKAALKEWAANVPDLRIRIFSLTKEENKKLDEALSQVYQVPESKRLVDHKLYMGEDYLWAEELHRETFEKLIAKYQGKGALPPWEKVTREALEKGEKSIIERFRKWSLSAVLIAGLIDGINPCAFATIIFLVSYLTFAGKKAKEILLYGAVFTSGVFVAYLLVGMGLMTFLHSLGSFPLISKGVYLFIAFFALALGLISLYDYVLFRRGQVAKWKLQLPMGLKKRIHEIIREQSRLKGGLLATFGAGFIIAVCTVICTGQVYLPTIGFVMSIPELKKNAILNLLLYNIMYIVPLVGVFVLTFFGVTSEKIAWITKEHTGGVKLLTAILFFALAMLLFLLH
ncbi:MAG: cytochrome c biogenesis CcdA family protein [Thermodesulfobacteriota bacterium]